MAMPDHRTACLECNRLHAENAALQARIATLEGALESAKADLAYERKEHREDLREAATQGAISERDRWDGP